MAYCSKCGTQIAEGSQFCPHCGTQVGSYENEQDTKYIPQPVAQHPAAPQNNSTHTILYVIIGLLSVALVGVVLLFLLTKNNDKIDEMKEQMKTLEANNKELTQKVEAAEANAKEADEEALAAKETAKTVQSVPKKTIVNEGAVHAADHIAASSGPRQRARVVINGVGVRLRFGPSLNAGYLLNSYGMNRSVPKGSKLQWNGYDDGDWYGVNYLGTTFYVSKQFSYLEY